MREVFAANALRQIEETDLAMAHYRTVRRLLDRVGHDGQVQMSIDDAKLLVGTDALGTLRSHLIGLANAGVIDYNINCQVVIGFLAWPAIAARAKSREIRSNSRGFRANLIESSTYDPPPTDAACSESARNRADSEQIRADFARIRADFARNRAPDDHFGGDKGGVVSWLDLSTPPSLEEANQPTNPAPNLETGPEPKTATADPVTHALGISLLIAAGIAPVQAKAIADGAPLELIQRAVGYWWDNREVKFRSPGIIVHWFKNLDSAGLPAELSPQFRRSDLYRRHRTRAQAAADAASGERALSYPPAPLPAHRGPSVPDNDPLSALWADIVATRNQSARLYLEGARLVTLDAGQARVVADPRWVSWLQAQMARPLERELALRGHEATRVVFEAAEVAHA